MPAARRPSRSATPTPILMVSAVTPVSEAVSSWASVVAELSPPPSSLLHAAATSPKAITRAASALHRFLLLIEIPLGYRVRTERRGV